MKELRKVTEQLIKWLKVVDQDISNMQKDVMKSLRQFHEDEEVLSKLESLISAGNSAKSIVEDHEEGLSVLAKSPPGIGSAIIDLMYAIVVNPKAETQKQRYLNSLRQLDRGYMEQTLRTLATSMGMVDESFLDVQHMLANEFSEGLDPDQKEVLSSGLRLAIASIFKSVAPPTSQFADMGTASKQLSQVIPQDRFDQLRQRLKAELARRIRNDAQRAKNFQILENGINSLNYIPPKQPEQEQKKEAQLILTAQAQADLAQVYKKWSAVFKQRIKESKGFIAQMQAAIAQHGDPERPRMTMRYLNYVKEFLGDHHERSLTRSFIEIVSILAKVTQTLENRAIDMHGTQGEAKSLTPENTQENAEQKHSQSSFLPERKIYSFTRKLEIRRN